MKKLLLSIATLFLSVSAFAQNYTINDGSSNVAGSNVSYFVANSVMDMRTYTVTNTSGSAVTIKVKKVNIQLNDPGAYTKFCTDQNCYVSTATYSLNVPMAVNGSFLLTCDYGPNFANGTTIVRYTVINQGNTADSVNFTITYNTTPAVIHTMTNVNPSVSEPMPNPASTIFAMNFKLGSTPVNNTKFIVYNMLGAQVLESDVMETEGVVKMDVSELEQGIYFCSLVSEGKTLATKRLVISH